MLRPKALVFDLDNTLCQCTEAYNEAKERMVHLILRRLPHLDAKGILDRFHDYDHQAMKSGNFGTSRFPMSMRAVFEILTAEHNVTPTQSELEEAYDIGESVFRYTYPLYTGAMELLAHYHAQGIPMALLTKGDNKVQLDKVYRNDIARFFVHIKTTETHKTPEDFLEVLGILKVDPKDAVSIGDSLKDDIETAKKAGLQTVHVTPQVTSPSMEKIGHSLVEPDVRLSSVRELPTVVTPQIPSSQTPSRRR